jgi:hypothetical protein
VVSLFSRIGQSTKPSEWGLKTGDFPSFSIEISSKVAADGLIEGETIIQATREFGHLSGGRESKWQLQSCI